MIFTEGDLEIDIPDVVSGGKFDGAGHGLNRCMEAVDFVVELADRYLFVKLKDPQHPLREADLLARKEALERSLPLRGAAGQPWPRGIVRACGVFNLESWNRTLPHCRVNRVGAGARNTGTEP